MTVFKRVAMVLASVALAACASSNGDRPAERPTQGFKKAPIYDDMSRLIEKDLGPALARQLTADPWLEGRPFLIVAMRDGTRQTSVDGLTRTLRQELERYLAIQPGIELRRPHPVVPPVQPHRVQLARCQDHGTEFDMLLGIELQPVDRRVMAVDLSAVDVVTGERLPLALRGRFSASKSDLELYSVLTPDLVVTGSLLDPFSADEIEPMARFLAFNLSCSTNLGTGPVYVNVSALLSEHDREVVELFKAYMIRYGGVEFADQSNGQEDLIILEAQTFDSDGARALWITGPRRASVSVHYRIDGALHNQWAATGRASWEIQTGATESERQEQALMVASSRARAQLARMVSAVTVDQYSFAVQGRAEREQIETRVRSTLMTRPLGEPVFDDHQRTVEVTFEVDTDWLESLGRGTP
jgi:hypothetical protein